METDKATYIADTTSTPPIPQIDTLSLVVECNEYVWQWRFYGIGPGPNPYIQGFTRALVNDDGLIYYQYVEFNSLAWAENSGYTVSPPVSLPLPPASSTGLLTRCYRRRVLMRRHPRSEWSIEKR